ncbi:MAG: SPOR domain-containing protein, partial [Rhodobacteraceae bacterium]|nr:SPOR domain-containing protein [Paracoccaceae bacterium]
AMGLAARVTAVQQGGRMIRLVTAGPFAGAALANALARIRAAGFADAYVRS